MSIARLSMNLSSLKMEHEASVGILKKAMELGVQSVETLLNDMMELQRDFDATVLAHLGKNIDITV